MSSFDEALFKVKLSTLISERQKWHDEFYVPMERDLISLLVKCYKLFQGYKGSRKAGAALDGIMKSLGLKPQSNTPMVTKIIKVVFESDRQRAYTYSVALRAADEADVKVDDLAAWIKGKGGVEEIRLASKGGKETPADRSELKEKGSRIIDSVDKSIGELPVVRSKITGVGEQLIIYIARPTSDTTAEALTDVPDPNGSLVKLALEILGKYAKDQSVSGNSQTTDGIAAKPEGVTDDQFVAQLAASVAEMAVAQLADSAPSAEGIN